MALDRLIDSLVADVTPVRRIARPGRRLALWLLVSVPTMALAALLTGLRPDLASRLADPVFLSQMGGRPALRRGLRLCGAVCRIARPAAVEAGGLLGESGPVVGDAGAAMLGKLAGGGLVRVAAAAGHRVPAHDRAVGAGAGADHRGPAPSRPGDTPLPCAVPGGAGRRVAGRRLTAALPSQRRGCHRHRLAIGQRPAVQLDRVRRCPTACYAARRTGPMKSP